jgi:5-aminolevulinate synthase
VRLHNNFLGYTIAAKMPCPFLTRLSPNYVKNYAAILLKMYGNQCPVISNNLSTVVGQDLKTGIQGRLLPGKIKIYSNFLDSQKSQSPCPFLKEVNNVIKEVKNDDIIEMKNEVHGMFLHVL